MSNTGLNSSIYHSTRSYLDLLNHFLVDVNYCNDIGQPFSNQRVLEFLNKLCDKQSNDPTLRLIRSVLQTYYRKHRKDLEASIRQLALKVERSEVDPIAVSEIEEYIDILKDQCEQSYARLKENE